MFTDILANADQTIDEIITQKIIINSRNYASHIL